MRKKTRRRREENPIKNKPDNSISKDKQDFFLMLVMAITKQEKEDEKTQEKCRIRVKEKIKDSPGLLKMFENDCNNAEKNETTNSIKLSCYINYVFGMDA